MKRWLKSRSGVYEVEKNDDGTLTITKGGKPIRRPADFINGCGGIEKILKRLCTKEEVERQIFIDMERKEDLRQKKDARFQEAMQIFNWGGSSAEELLKALCVFVRGGYTHLVDDILKQNNALATEILKHGSFSWAIYEKEVVVTVTDHWKGKKKKWSTSRHSAIHKARPLAELLFGKEYYA